MIISFSFWIMSWVAMILTTTCYLSMKSSCCTAREAKRRREPSWRRCCGRPRLRWLWRASAPPTASLLHIDIFNMALPLPLWCGELLLGNAHGHTTIVNGATTVDSLGSNGGGSIWEMTESGVGGENDWCCSQTRQEGFRRGYIRFTSNISLISSQTDKLSI
jgi:hypothetical protein